MAGDRRQSEGSLERPPPQRAPIRDEEGAKNPAKHPEKEASVRREEEVMRWELSGERFKERGSG